MFDRNEKLQLIEAEQDYDKNTAKDGASNGEPQNLAPQWSGHRGDITVTSRANSSRCQCSSAKNLSDLEQYPPINQSSYAFPQDFFYKWWIFQDLFSCKGPTGFRS